MTEAQSYSRIGHFSSLSKAAKFKKIVGTRIYVVSIIYTMALICVPVVLLLLDLCSPDGRGDFVHEELKIWWLRHYYHPKNTQDRGSLRHQKRVKGQLKVLSPSIHSDISPALSQSAFCLPQPKTMYPLGQFSLVGGFSTVTTSHHPPDASSHSLPRFRGSYNRAVTVSTVVKESALFWIWDAVMTDSRSLVVVLLMDTFDCAFDKQTLRNGDIRHEQQSNKSLDAASSSNYIIPRSSKSRLIGSHVLCRFYDQKSQYLGSLPSLKISEAMVVRCPVPAYLRVRRHRLSLRLHDSLAISAGGVHGRRGHKGNINSSVATTTTSSSGSSATTGFTLSRLFPACFCPKIDEISYHTSNVSSKLKSVWRSVTTTASAAMDHKSKRADTGATTPNRLLDGVPIIGGGEVGGGADHFFRLSPFDIHSPILLIDLDSKSPSQNGSIYFSNDTNTLSNRDADDAKDADWSNLDNANSRVKNRPLVGKPTTTRRRDRFNLSVCAVATEMHTDKSLLYEWIEFHRALGVQHFFLYDTSSRAHEYKVEGGKMKESEASKNSATPPRQHEEHTGNDSVAPSLSRRHRRSLLTQREQSDLLLFGLQWIPKMISGGFYFILSVFEAPFRYYTDTLNSSASVAEVDDDDDAADDDDVPNKTRPHQVLKLNEMLAAYIQAGIVTFIPWHFEGCGKTDLQCLRRSHNSGSDKDGVFPEDCGTCKTSINTNLIPHASALLDMENEDFPHSMRSEPPTLRHMAYRSCYVRFRETSLWMSMLQVNEFIALNTDKRLSPVALASNLHSLIAHYQETVNDLAVIELSSHRAYVPCPSNFLSGLISPVNDVTARSLLSSFDHIHSELAAATAAGGDGDKDSERKASKKDRDTENMMARGDSSIESGTSSKKKKPRFARDMTENQLLSVRDAVESDEDGAATLPRLGSFLHSIPLTSQPRLTRLLVRCESVLSIADINRVDIVESTQSRMSAMLMTGSGFGPGDSFPTVATQRSRRRRLSDTDKMDGDINGQDGLPSGGRHHRRRKRHEKGKGGRPLIPPQRQNDQDSGSVLSSHRSDSSTSSSSTHLDYGFVSIAGDVLEIAHFRNGYDMTDCGEQAETLHHRHFIIARDNEGRLRQLSKHREGNNGSSFVHAGVFSSIPSAVVWDAVVCPKASVSPPEFLIGQYYGGKNDDRVTFYEAVRDRYYQALEGEIPL